MMSRQRPHGTAIHDFDEDGWPSSAADAPVLPFRCRLPIALYIDRSRTRWGSAGGSPRGRGPVIASTLQERHDSLGMPMGDLLIAQVGDRLPRRSSRTPRPCWGAEFALLLIDVDESSGGGATRVSITDRPFRLTAWVAAIGRQRRPRASWPGCARHRHAPCGRTRDVRGGREWQGPYRVLCRRCTRSPTNDSS